MKREAIAILILILLMITKTASSQTIDQPEFAIKSHPTLEIKKIEISARATKVFLSVENLIEGGSFCADKDIYIITPDGTKLKLSSSEGIPVCPDEYKFRSEGEILDFSLTFSILKAGIKEIDIIEDCAENCFSFYGVVTDNDINKKINDAFIMAEDGNTDKALAAFEQIADEETKKGLAINALLYVNIIQLSNEAGNKAKSAAWYQKFKTSGIASLSKYIEFLSDNGIQY